MPKLTVSAAHALDAAVVSLAAFHVVDWLLRCRPAPVGLKDMSHAAGLPLGEVAYAVDTLCARGVLSIEGGQVSITPPYLHGLVAAWHRMAVDGALRRKVLGTAAEREAQSSAITLRVVWAPG